MGRLERGKAVFVCAWLFICKCIFERLLAGLQGSSPKLETGSQDIKPRRQRGFHRNKEAGDEDEEEEA